VLQEGLTLISFFPQSIGIDQKPTFLALRRKRTAMPIKVLAFAGSPRRHGNSEILLDWVLDSLMGDPGCDH
jgi:hypothetical protein